MRARLQFTTGSIAGRELEVGTSPARIGRQEGSEFVIPSPDDTYVSRHHASVHLEGDRLVIVDQGSTNGTLVNGQRVQSAFLNHGDTVQFGKDGPIAQVILEHSQPQQTRMAPDVGTPQAPVPVPATPQAQKPEPGFGAGGGAPPAQVPPPPRSTYGASCRRRSENTRRCRRSSRSLWPFPGHWQCWP